MLNEQFFVFLTVYLIDSIIPGPAVVMVMARGATVGLLRTLPFIAGLVVGDICLFLLALLGLAALAQALGPLFFVIKWIGVCYLLFLAYSAWNDRALSLDAMPAKAAADGWSSYGLATILPLGNPKAVGFYLALLPAVMDVSNLNLSTALLFTTAIIVIWGSCLIFYTVIADRGRRYFNNSAMRKWLNRGAAGALTGAAGTIAFREQ